MMTTHKEEQHEPSQDTQAEINSGWIRTLITGAMGALALAGSTYTVVSKITSFEHAVIEIQKDVVSLDGRVIALEQSQLPSGIERTRLTSAIENITHTLDRIERRLDRIEQREQIGGNR